MDKALLFSIAPSPVPSPPGSEEGGGGGDEEEEDEAPKDLMGRLKEAMSNPNPKRNPDPNPSHNPEPDPSPSPNLLQGA